MGDPNCDPGDTGKYWNFDSRWKSAAAVSKTTVMMLRFAADVAPADSTARVREMCHMGSFHFDKVKSSFVHELHA